MGQGAIFARSSNSLWSPRAADFLTQVKPDWRDTEYFYNAGWALGQFRKALSLE